MKHWKTPAPTHERSVFTPTPGGGPGDVHHEAIPGMEVCDFCTSAAVAWTFPAGVVDLSDIGAYSDDPWDACEECAHFIREGNLSHLVTRGIDGFMRASEREGLTVELQEVYDMRRTFRRIYQAFMDARTGEPYRP